MTELNWKSAAKLVKGYAAGKFSPVEVTKACLAQIERHEGALNAMVEIRGDEALTAARLSDRKVRRLIVMLFAPRVLKSTL